MDKPENINILKYLYRTHTKSHAQKKIVLYPWLDMQSLRWLLLILILVYYPPLKCGLDLVTVPDK